jgi:hypothetical protein
MRGSVPLLLNKPPSFKCLYLYTPLRIFTTILHEIHVLKKPCVKKLTNIGVGMTKFCVLETYELTNRTLLIEGLSLNVNL